MCFYFFIRLWLFSIHHMEIFISNIAEYYRIQVGPISGGGPLRKI